MFPYLSFNLMKCLLFFSFSFLFWNDSWIQKVNQWDFWLYLFVLATLLCILSRNEMKQNENFDLNWKTCDKINLIRMTTEVFF